jgi:conjugal transfer pilus assembly protein TrbC
MRFSIYFSVLCAGLPCKDSMAQGNPLVTDADIELIQRNQPAITERDLARAREKYRMPTEQEMSRVPIPATPNLDALPQPHASRPIDLETLAKDYEANADRILEAQELSAGPSLLIFVSFSMPQLALQRLAEQAAKTQAVLVLRGLVHDSLRDTVEQIQKIIGNHQVAIQIDPQAFDRFSIRVTPSFVLVRAGTRKLPCAAGLCLPPDTFAATSGDVSLDYALEFIAHRAPRFAGIAHPYLKKIRK